MYAEVNVDGREEAVDEADEPPGRVEGDGDREQDDAATTTTECQALVQRSVNCYYIVLVQGAHRPSRHELLPRPAPNHSRQCLHNQKEGAIICL